ncbi:MAG TPA: hypothetical protein VIH99_07015 [Bdellovibrionota bacterium]|jgi:hypothetical protein
MPTDPRLENYLATLDRVLTPIPVSDRADIVTEIKSHVLSALDRDPKPAMDTVLEALGPAEVVANRYLLERGLKPAKPPVSPIVKWLVIGFLGTMGIAATFVMVLAFRFAPLVQVNESEEKVSLLGGLIQIEGEGDISFGDFAKFEGESTETFAPGNPLGIYFGSGKMSVNTADGKKLRWECKGKGTPPKGLATKDGTKSLDLTGFAGVKCEVYVPQGVKLNVGGTNGKVNFEQAKFSVDANLTNGKVSFNAADGTKFAYDFSVERGKADHPNSDANPDYTAKIRVTNGKISN